MVKQRQELEQRQLFSQQQIEQIKLLELPQAALEARIREEAIANPALELLPPEGDTPSSEGEERNLLQVQGENPSDISLDDYASQDDIPLYKLKLVEGYQTRETPFAYPTDSPTLGESLRHQLSLQSLDPTTMAIAEQIVGNLGEDGYLRTQPREIEDYLLFIEGIAITPEQYEQALEIVQQLDPPGVAARDLQECLLLQLHSQTPTPTQQHACAIVQDHFEDLANRRFERIEQELSLSREEFLSAQSLIRSLNPKPGNGFGSDMEAAASRISPDFEVHFEEGLLTVSLYNQGRIPRLGITTSYQVLTATRKERNKQIPPLEELARKQVTAAKTFIEAINRRRTTLLRTMETIVTLQEPFFLSGDASELRPMVLRDIAERVGHDISTISRITSEKYVQTDYGIYPLKFFFSEATRSGEEGQEVAARSVKERLRSLIDHEDKANPLTDEELVTQLTQEGFPVARRTIAKYRTQMQIPVARLRREIL